METQPKSIAGKAPRLITSLVAGFNSVANHIYLILFPVILDLFLWFGPHLRVKDYFQPAVSDLLSTLSSFNTVDVSDLVSLLKDTWTIILEHFNLASTLRTYPIGVPSLLSSAGPLTNPLGAPLIFEVTSFSTIFGWCLLFSAIGLGAGVIYFYTIARASDEEKLPFSTSQVIWLFGQTLLLTLICLLLVVIVSVPTIILISILAMLSPLIAQAVMFIAGIIIMWLIVPLVFSPHGIFAFRLGAVKSILTSTRLVRSFLPGTSLFLLVAVLISQGMDILWRVPPENSWLTLVAITGHSFINTALISASFIYYRNGMKWMAERLQSVNSSARV